MTTNIATTHWTGDLRSGSGTVSLETSGAGEFTVSWPARVGEATAQTSPEELIAAAHATCLAMNFNGVLAKAGLAADSVDVTADVTFERTNEGPAITGIALELVATMTGVEEERFAELAAQAERTCPVSRALAATPITLDARLAS
jgi:osmotically inducible protein OsmC